LSDLDDLDPNIHGATLEGIMRELCNAFVRRRGAVPSVPDMMKTYRRVVRQLDDVLVNAGANSLFEARVLEDLCFVTRAIVEER
jgi:hypothetical protein